MHGVPAEAHRHGAAVAEQLRLLGISPDSVYAVESYNPTTYEAAPDVIATCSKMIDLTGGNPLLKDLSISEAEAVWAAGTILQPLNAELVSASNRHDWNFVGGVAGELIENGYCAADPWVVTLPESIALQGDASGTLHPDANGHARISELIQAAADGQLDDPSEIDGVDPRTRIELFEAAQARDRSIRHAEGGLGAPAAPASRRAPRPVTTLAQVPGVSGLEGERCRLSGS